MATMKKTIVVYRVADIHPDTKSQCSGRCGWRDGHACTLFNVLLKPKSANPKETRCHRSIFCQRAEESVVVHIPENQDLEENAG